MLQDFFAFPAGRSWNRQDWQSPSNTEMAAIVQLFSRVWLFATPWTAARQASLSVTISRSLLKLMIIESMMPSNLLILCRTLLLLPLIFPSIRIFSDEMAVGWIKFSNVVVQFLFNIRSVYFQVNACFSSSHPRHLSPWEAPSFYHLALDTHHCCLQMGEWAGHRVQVASIVLITFYLPNTKMLKCLDLKTSDDL